MSVVIDTAQCAQQEIEPLRRKRALERRDPGQKLLDDFPV
jgi:hypothetical protein